MQSINRAILNLMFLGVFLGTALLLPFATWFSYGTGPNLRFWLLLSAAACYLVGTFGVTMFGNVSLNEAARCFPAGKRRPGPIGRPTGPI